MRSAASYVPAAAMGVAFVCRLPGAVRAWRDPLVRSVCVLLGLAAAVFFFAAPPTVAEVNRATGIANASAPLVYGLLSAFSAATLVLIVNWRGGPPDRTRRVTRALIAVYGLVTVALAVLFALGSAPVERPRDLDTYYATTPYIREMIVLHLVATAAPACGVCVLCWRWVRQVRSRWLRASLLTIATGYLCDVAYVWAKLTAVAARWRGADLDTLSTDAAPLFASVGALIAALGFLLPLAGPRLCGAVRTCLTHWRLAPLWRELRPSGQRESASVRIAWWAAPGLRATRRETQIHDGLLDLQPFLDDAVRVRAYEAALASGSDAADAGAVGDAAMVAVAVRVKAGAAADAGSRPAGPTTAVTAGGGAGARSLARVSRALRSPIVTAARQTAAQESGAVGGRRGGRAAG
ncbi:MAB_1171c family putative transporter [Streptomyces sp. O3]